MKQDFKRYIIEQMKDISNAIDKIYLSKENKFNQWGVYSKCKNINSYRYETYIPYEENNFYLLDMINSIKEEIKNIYKGVVMNNER